MKRLILLLLLLAPALAAPPEMKTHSSVVKGAKLTVVHLSAPW